MSTERYCTPTNAGNSLFAAIVAAEAGLEFTKVLVGTGQPDADANPADLASLVEYKAAGTMTDPVQEGEKVSFTVEYRNDLNDGLTEGFWLREFGIWAKQKDAEDSTAVMVYYGCLGDYPQYVEAYDGSHVDSRRFPLNITVGNAASVTVSFSTDAFVTSKEMASYVGAQTGDLGGKTIATLLSELETTVKEYTDDAANIVAKTAKTALAATDVLAVQGASNTVFNKVTAQKLAEELVRLYMGGTAPNLIALHNNIVRGKVLTDTYTIEQIMTMVAARNYSDIYIGDIIKASVPAISVTGFTAATVEFLVAEIESHYNYGDTKLTKGHLCLIPKGVLGYAKMNASNTTVGAYYNSYMHQTVMPAVNTALASAFGSSHILTTREIPTIVINTSSNSKGVPIATGATYWNSTPWVDCQARLMTELEAYNSSEFSSSGEDGRGGLPHQLALLKRDPTALMIGAAWWHSAVAYSANFCLTSGGGDVYHVGASSSLGVRPRFVVG